MAFRPTWTDTPLRQKVFAKTGGRCFFCGIHVKLNDKDPLPRDWLVLRGRGDRLMTPDHGHPKIRGGLDGVENRLPSCRPCNSAKGALTVEEFRFVRAFRARDLNLMHGGEGEPDIKRDWLCLWSDDQERPLFVANFPWAADAYSRGWASRGKSYAAPRRK